MGIKDFERKFEVRARARTSSTEDMIADSVPLIPNFSHSLPLPEMAVIGLDTVQRKLSMYQIFLLNAVVCGVEICACAGFTFIPPLLLKSGYTEENMSIILGIGPMLGFFIVPLIGRASDKCQSKLGRRRPFILGLSFLLILALLTVPYSDRLCYLIFGTGPLGKSVAVLLLTIGAVMLDFASQSCLTPCEALLSDASKDTDQHERVFIIYSLMASLGGIIGYLITAIDWNATMLGAIFKTQERTVFSILTALFTLLLFATMFAAKEKPSLQGEQSDEDEENVQKSLLEINSTKAESIYKCTSENGCVLGLSLKQEPTPALQHASLATQRNRSPSNLSPSRTCCRSLQTCRPVCIILNVFKLIWVNVYAKLPYTIKKLFHIPYVLRKLSLVHFCSWTAVMGFNLFFTDFVGNAVFQGNPKAPEDSFLRNRFDEGVRMGSWGLLLHCITSAFYSLFVEKLVARYGCKLTYFLGMMSFSLAMFGMVVFPNPMIVILMASVTGFAYATLTTIPFILVSKYHSEKEIYFFDDIPKMSSGTSNLPVRGIATDMATLDSAYFLSQVTLSGLMGYVVYMTGSQLSYMATAGVMGILAVYCIQNVVTCKQDIVIVKQSLNNL